MDIFSVITLFGGLAFFLYGMNIMSSGLEKLAGGKLESILRKMTSNPIKSLALGLGITMAVQSSSAVTVMLVGLVNSGIMQLSQTIGVLFGSNIGTTVTAWLLTLSGIDGSSVLLKLLKPDSFAPVLALIGVIMTMLAKHSKTKDIGHILAGFAILFTGMNFMSDAVAPLKDSEAFRELMTAFNNPILGVAAGAIITAIIQSSSASVGILQAISLTGQLTYGMCIPIIMGQNIGTCITALISSIGVNRSARRVAIIHITFNCIGTLILLPLYLLLDAFIGFAFTDMPADHMGIAIVHTIFNVVTTIILLPFTRMLEKIAYFVIKEKDEEKEKKEIIVLDERLLNTPAVAIEACRSTTIRMAELARDTILKSMELQFQYDEAAAEKIRQLEDEIDTYEDKLNAYLVRISKHSISSADSKTVSKMLHCIGNFERIGDHALNIMESAKETHDKGIHFSSDAMSEIRVVTDALTQTIQLAFDAFIQNDLTLARQVEPLEEVIDTLNIELKNRHIKRLQNNACTVELGYIYQDLLTNFERVSDHCSNIAGCLIEVDEKQDIHAYLHDLKKTDETFQREYHQHLDKYFLALGQPVEAAHTGFVLDD
ncbi:MAG: Na/Pi cotransporter family protein [Ruminococcus sp.]|nr:Na/Pi cotransporter family protein [Ruminococcus sp.]